MVAVAFFVWSGYCFPSSSFGWCRYLPLQCGGAVFPSSFFGGVVFLSLPWVAVLSPSPVLVLLRSLLPSLGCCCSPLPVLLGGRLAPPGNDVVALLVFSLETTVDQLPQSNVSRSKFVVAFAFDPRSGCYFPLPSSFGLCCSASFFWWPSSPSI